MQLDERYVDAWIKAYFATPNGTDPAKMADHVVQMLADRRAFDDSVIGSHGSMDSKDVVADVEKMLSAVGDVVKVPPHWHVKLRATASDEHSGVMDGDEVIFGLNAVQVHYANVLQSAFAKDGVVVFDVITTMRASLGESASLRMPRAGVASSATVIAVY